MKNVFFALLVIFIIGCTNVPAENPKTECTRVGVEWKEFPNSCADTCSFERGESDICAQVLTDSCDCGPSMCWNGQTCVVN